MILGFKEQFKQKILDGSKIHTIREDTNNRWSIGKTIHFVTGVRTKKYNQFASGICIGYKSIRIDMNEDGGRTVSIDGYTIYSNCEHVCKDDTAMEKLARNDGFDSIEDFFKWFNKDFTGKIIYWHLL